MILAEWIEPGGRQADSWTVRLRDGVVFHDGRPLRAEDVIFSLRRIVDPKDPKVGASLIGDIDVARMRKLDARTVRIPLERPNATFLDAVGVYNNGIVPAEYDPKRPVGTGPFKFKSFAPGQQSTLVRNPRYWREGQPLVDELADRRLHPGHGEGQRAAQRPGGGHRPRPGGAAGPGAANRRCAWSPRRPGSGSRSRCGSTRSRSTTCASARRSG